MQISIEAIDADSMQSIGCTRMPSYEVTFRSPTVCGKARFVPASTEVNSCTGQSFEVEVSQERVTGLRSLGNHPLAESVTALPESGAFQIQGVVTSIVSLTEPAGMTVVAVAARGALFSLAGEELGGVKLSLGEKVTFIAHDVSLWDAAI